MNIRPLRLLIAILVTLAPTFGAYFLGLGTLKLVGSTTSYPSFEIWGLGILILFAFTLSILVVFWIIMSLWQWITDNDGE